MLCRLRPQAWQVRDVRYQCLSTDTLKVTHLEKVDTSRQVRRGNAEVQADNDDVAAAFASLDKPKPRRAARGSKSVGPSRGAQLAPEAADPQDSGIFSASAFSMDLLEAFECDDGPDGGGPDGPDGPGPNKGPAGGAADGASASSDDESGTRSQLDVAEAAFAAELGSEGEALHEPAFPSDVEGDAATPWVVDGNDIWDARRTVLLGHFV
eukprot:10109623-Lingulodinium_polyedra.AAC.1